MGFAYFLENTIANLYSLGLQNGQSFDVVCVGGGGGGAGNNAESNNINCSNGYGFGGGIKGKAKSGGGTGGDIKFDTFVMNNTFDNISIVVGKTGESYLEDNSGANGGTTSFGSLLTASGGLGGQYMTNTIAKYNSRPKGLTSSGGIPMSKNNLTNVQQNMNFSYCGGAGGGGYMPGVEEFGGTPGHYINGNSETAGNDGTGLSGYMANNSSDWRTTATESRKKVFRLPSVWGGRNTSETGIVCLYW